MKSFQHFILVSMFLLFMELLVSMVVPLNRFTKGGHLNYLQYLGYMSAVVAVVALMSVCSSSELTPTTYRANIYMQYVWIAVDIWFIIGGALKFWPFKDATKHTNGDWVALGCYVLLDMVLRFGKIACAYGYLKNFEKLWPKEREQAWKSMPCCQATRQAQRDMRRGEIRPDFVG